MYIIIIGGGRVGYYLAKELLGEGHEVFVLEKDAKTCSQMREELGSICAQGDGCEAATLEEAGTSRADMLIATTDEDEDNLVACQVAKYKFNVPYTIARINNPKHEALFKRLGIDATVSSTGLILEHIEQKVPTHPLTHVLSLDYGTLELVQLKIRADSPAVGMQLGEIPLPPGSILCLIVRKDGDAQVPSADIRLEPGDQIIAVTKPEKEMELRTALARH